MSTAQTATEYGRAIMHAFVNYHLRCIPPTATHMRDAGGRMTFTPGHRCNCIQQTKETYTDAVASILCRECVRRALPRPEFAPNPT